ncbi:filamentous hemagglutinin family outer membrane protein [Leptolyngbya sp. Heron Island J]|uniref:CHAT domain-containing protein n=1 Tax=Leptolyngbya sp. Heron Island J TaxID=1385935 RepID=UPI0003B9D18D|nr:CHAT domain-containing protein [Leptolyngbya sp. Heron Island J]ESA33143.1 filamentous hemagglutinin family outer membrane protein [Leptolyngbya sp. Heron Island J]
MVAMVKPTLKRLIVKILVTTGAMVKFYNALQQLGTTQVAVLQQAQLAVLQPEDYEYPFFWAAFIMVGNWLSWIEKSNRVYKKK